MREINQKFTDIIKSKQNWMYLAGAGCSIDPPSSLPDGNSLKKQLLRFCCPNSEYENLLSIVDLQLENLLKIIQNQWDKSLKCLDFFEHAYNPNNIHFYLARQMLGGSPILTTNFDFLIEHALLRKGASKDGINLVITKEDFKDYESQNKDSVQGRPVLFKLHGSTKNILTGVDLHSFQKSLINDIGTYKNEFSLFFKHPYKSYIFNHSSKLQNLVILGYSGKNDRDMLPTLLNSNNFQTIIWIDHKDNPNNTERTFEIIYTENDISLEKFNKIERFLIDLKRSSPATKIYKIEGHTKKLLNPGETPELKTQEGLKKISYYEWLSNNMIQPDEVSKYLISHIIYFNFERYDDALRCGVRVLEKVDEDKEREKEFVIRNNLGWIHYNRGNNSEAINNFQTILDILEAQHNNHDKIIYYNNIGEIFEKMKDFQKALDYYEKALNIPKNSVKVNEKLNALESIVSIKKQIGETEAAISYYEKALDLTEKIQNNERKAVYINNMASIYCEKEKFDVALDLFNQSKDILQDLDNLELLATNLNNMGTLFQKTNEYNKALSNFKEALRIDTQIGNNRGKALRLNKIGEIHILKENYTKAMDKFKKSLQIAGKINNDLIKLKVYKNIGKTHFYLKDYGEAIIAFQLGKNLSEKLEKFEIKADFLNNIAGCYYMTLDFEKSLKNAQEALQTLKLSGGSKSIKSIQLEKRIKEIKSQLDEN